MSSCMVEINEARRWLAENCHAAHVKHMLERGLDYYEAVVRAGLCTDLTEGDVLSDAESARSRSRHFLQPTL
jgi:hypothetical protein